MRVIRRLAVVGFGLTILFSLATLPNHLHPLLEQFSHFRGQYLAAALLLLLVFALLREGRLALYAALLVGVNAWPVIPYYQPVELPASSEYRLEVLHANVFRRNGDKQSLLSLVETERPDIVFLQEVGFDWAAALRALESDYPHFSVEPRNDAFGIAVYSRLPLTSVAVLDSPPLAFPTLLVSVEVGGQQVHLVSSHPMSPVSTAANAARNEQLVHLAELMNSLPAPKLLIGDLNIGLWSHHYQRLLTATQLADARRGFGLLPTWPVPMLPLMIPIDHCLVSPDLAVAALRVGPNIGSDHGPLLVTLGLDGVSHLSAVRPE